MLRLDCLIGLCPRISVSYTDSIRVHTLVIRLKSPRGNPRLCELNSPITVSSPHTAEHRPTWIMNYQPIASMKMNQTQSSSDLRQTSFAYLLLRKWIYNNHLPSPEGAAVFTQTSSCRPHLHPILVSPEIDQSYPLIDLRNTFSSVKWQSYLQRSCRVMAALFSSMKAVLLLPLPRMNLRLLVPPNNESQISSLSYLACLLFMC